MTNESVLQKLLDIIEKEREVDSIMIAYDYHAGMDFVMHRILEMQIELHNKRIESISVDMKHEILNAYESGFSKARNEIMGKLHSIEDDIPYADDAAVEYYNKRFVFKK